MIHRGGNAKAKGYKKSLKYVNILNINFKIFKNFIVNKFR